MSWLARRSRLVDDVEVGGVPVGRSGCGENPQAAACVQRQSVFGESVQDPLLSKTDEDPKRESRMLKGLRGKREWGENDTPAAVRNSKQ
jgi:hypothetical protein